MAIRVKGRLHWGFCVKGIAVSKRQYSLKTIPPTTLIGAISYPLSTFYHRDSETIISLSNGRYTLSSSTNVFYKMFRLATISFNGYGKYVEDMNQYILLHFQTLIKEDGEVRRYRMKYRRGRMVVGRVYMPNGEFDIVYVVDDDKAKDVLGEGFLDALYKSAWNITRLGSKESLVSIDDVKIYRDIIRRDGGIYTTRFYFPLTSIRGAPRNGVFYLEKFWVGGYSRGEEIKYIEYIIPGTPDPVRSMDVEVEVGPMGEAYILPDGLVVIGAKSKE